MRKSEYRKMFEAEPVYFWFIAKQGLVDRLLGRIALPKQAAILDLGCGTGNNLKRLEKFGFAVGLEYFPEPFSYCLMRGCRELVLSPGEVLPFAGEIFSLATSLDTIEHTRFPESMVREVFRTLKPGGYFLITAPAYPRLYSNHDYALGHRMRYPKKELDQLLRSAGFTIALKGNYFGGVFPLAALVKVWQKFFGSKTETIRYRLPFPVNQTLLALCRLETIIFPWFRLPFGTTLVFLCRKPQ